MTGPTVRLASMVRSTASGLRGDGRGRMLLAVAFGWFLSISVRMIYPALLPYLRDAYGLTLTTAGLLLTVLWMAYALGQLPGGIVADRVGERLALVVSSAAAAAMLALVTLANSAVVLFVATALFGLGTALYGVSRFTILERIYPDQLGTATGVTMAAGDVGNTLMPPAAGFVAAAVAWQLGFGFSVPLFVVAAVALWTTLPPRSGGSPSLRGSIDFGGIRATLSRPAVVRGTVLLVLWGVVIQAFIGFYPTYLIDEKGIASGTAALLFGFFFALGILMKPIAGRAYDEIGVRLPVIVITVTASAALVGLSLAEGLAPLVLVTVLAGSLLGFETIVIADLTGRLPDGTRGTNLGALRTIYISLGALSPVAFGAVADRGFFDEAFLGVAAIAGLVAVVTFVAVDY